MLSYLQAVLIGLLQGVTELFPVSSLGHSVLVPAWLGGRWQALVEQSASANSEHAPYLAFIVALLVATALALLAFFWRDWVRIVGGSLQTLRSRRVETPDQRLACLIIVATIPVGLTGLLLEHPLRTLFAKPLAAAVFLTVNGGILLAGERLRRGRSADATAAPAPTAATDAASPAVTSPAAASPAGPLVRARRGPLPGREPPRRRQVLRLPRQPLSRRLLSRRLHRRPRTATSRPATPPWRRTAGWPGLSTARASSSGCSRSSPCSPASAGPG